MNNALDSLIDALEIGRTAVMGVAMEAFPQGCWGQICDAYEGSLDAAKAFNDYVLPKSEVFISGPQDGQWRVLVVPAEDLKQGFDVFHPNRPSRAWVIATLQAHRFILDKNLGVAPIIIDIRDQYPPTLSL